MNTGTRLAAATLASCLVGTATIGAASSATAQPNPTPRATTTKSVTSNFASGSAKLTAKQKSELKSAAAAVAASGSPAAKQSVVVTGRSNSCASSRSISLRGDVAACGTALAKARAGSVARYLKSIDFQGTITKKSVVKAKNNKASRTAKSVFSYEPPAGPTFGFVLINDTFDGMTNPEPATPASASFPCNSGTCTATAAQPSSSTPTQTTGSVLQSNPVVTITVVPKLDTVSSPYWVGIAATGGTCTPTPDSSGANPAVFTCTVSSDGAQFTVTSLIV